jgi:hypothetical protein
MLTRDNVAGNLAKILNVDSKSEFPFSQDTAYLNLLQRFNKDFLQKSSNLNLDVYKEIIAYEEKMALPFNDSFDSFDGDNEDEDVELIKRVETNIYRLMKAAKATRRKHLK